MNEKDIDKGIRHIKTVRAKHTTVREPYAFMLQFCGNTMMNLTRQYYKVSRQGSYAYYYVPDDTSDTYENMREAKAKIVERLLEGSYGVVLKDKMIEAIDSKRKCKV